MVVAGLWVHGVAAYRCAGCFAAWARVEWRTALLVRHARLALLLACVPLLRDGLAWTHRADIGRVGPRLGDGAGVLRRGEAGLVLGLEHRHVGRVRLRRVPRLLAPLLCLFQLLPHALLLELLCLLCQLQIPNGLLEVRHGLLHGGLEGSSSSPHEATLGSAYSSVNKTCDNT